jgi:hypothetical protein
MISLGTEGRGKLGRWDKELIVMASNVHEIPKHTAVFLVSRYYKMVSTFIANSDGFGLTSRPENQLLRHFPDSVRVNAGIVLKSRPRPLLFRFQSIIWILKWLLGWGLFPYGWALHIFVSLMIEICSSFNKIYFFCNKLFVLDHIPFYIDHYVRSGTIEIVVKRIEETNIVIVRRDVGFLRDH